MTDDVGRFITKTQNSVKPAVMVACEYAVIAGSLGLVAYLLLRT